MLQQPSFYLSPPPSLLGGALILHYNPPMPDPLYTPHNCATPAYQLDWSYSLFWREPPSDFNWLRELQTTCERDHIRILQHQFEPPNLSQFLVSTVPSVAPLLIAQRLKGRLQHLLGQSPFRRNYAIRSLGPRKMIDLPSTILQ
jgi:hypothetical protein